MTLLTQLAELRARIRVLEDAEGSIWKKGWIAGSYRPDWKGPCRGSEADEAWEYEQERRARAALGSAKP